jgi:hypothetical protein
LFTTKTHRGGGSFLLPAAAAVEMVNGIYLNGMVNGGKTIRYDIVGDFCCC